MTSLPTDLPQAPHRNLLQVLAWTIVPQTSSLFSLSLTLFKINCKYSISLENTKKISATEQISFLPSTNL